MANVYVYDAVAIAAGILPNAEYERQVIIMLRVWRKKNQNVIFSCGSPSQLVLQYMQWNVRLRELVRLKLQFKTSSFKLKS